MGEHGEHDAVAELLAPLAEEFASLLLGRDGVPEDREAGVEHGLRQVLGGRGRGIGGGRFVRIGLTIIRAAGRVSAGRYVSTY